jgi:hypothetical protein
MADEIYLTPTDELSYDDVEETFADLDATEQGPEEGYLKSWKIGPTRVRYFEDAGLHVGQFVVDGKDRDEVAQRLRERLPIYSPADMPRLFDEIDEESELLGLLRLLAAVAPKKADPRLVELFERGFNHDDPLIREQAALSAVVPAWPELRRSVERLANEDDDENVRESAATALGDFDRPADAG